MHDPEKPRRILFVCLGNICRSPAAEIIFRHQCAAAGMEHLLLADSAGTIGHHQGAPPDPRMAETLRRRGYRPDGRARQIRHADLRDSELILTMDESNRADVLGLDPEGIHHAKVRPFVGFCRRHDVPRVPDPYYGGSEGFEHVVTLLEDGCAGILAALGGQPAAPVSGTR
jgi:protein-tyrosine phosphatase